jgi:hypothetical protein
LRSARRTKRQIGQNRSTTIRLLRLMAKCVAMIAFSIAKLLEFLVG